MKKLLIILILIFFLFGCNDNYNNIENPEIPSLMVSFDNDEITVVRGTYDWTITDGKYSTNFHADTESSEKIAEYMNGNIILPQTQLNLKFSQTPRKVNVIYWGEIIDVEYNFTDSIITVPNEEGIYVFEIVSEWEKGKVSYTIKIIVKNN